MLGNLITVAILTSFFLARALDCVEILCNVLYRCVRINSVLLQMFMMKEIYTSCSALWKKCIAYYGNASCVIICGTASPSP